MIGLLLRTGFILLQTSPTPSPLPTPTPTPLPTPTPGSSPTSTPSSSPTSTANGTATANATSGAGAGAGSPVDNLPVPPSVLVFGLFAIVIGYAIIDEYYLSDDDKKKNTGGMPTMDFHELFEEHQRRSTGSDSPVGVQAGISAMNPGEGQTVGDILDQHQSLVTPAEYEEDSRMPIVDGEYVKSLVVTDFVVFEDYPIDGFLKEVFDLTDVKFDMTVYMRPFGTREGADAAKLRRQETDYDADKRLSEGLKAEADKAKRIQQAVEGGHSLFRSEMVVTVRGDTVDEVEEAEKKVRDVLTSSPAGCEVKVIPSKANDCLRATEPFGDNPLAKADESLFQTWMVSGAVASVLSSLQNPTHIEASGFEVGLHKQTQTPVFVDPFEREDGHSLAVIAKQGGGKSVSAKTSFLEYVSKNEDVIGVVIEPLGNWKGVIEAARYRTPDEFKAEHIIVGSNKGINPLDISEVPEERRGVVSETDVDPLSESVASSVQFVMNFLSLRGEMDSMPGKEVLEAAIWDAYYEKGITKDLDTHGRETPRFTAVMKQLEKRVENPEEYTNRHQAEAERIKDDSVWFLRKLSPFEPKNDETGHDRSYANFSKQTEFSLDDSDMYYLDLNRAEGNMGDKEALTMQLLIEQVYEMAKRRDERVVIAMDEFRYLMHDAMDLDFLNTLYRHQRHHEISPWLMTQTLGEFLDTAQGKQILNLQSIRQFHNIDEMNDEWRKDLNMSKKAMEAVQRAAPGSRERGFSDTVIEIDGQWREAEVHVPPKLMEIVEWDPDDPDPDTNIYEICGVEPPEEQKPSQNIQSNTTVTDPDHITPDGGEN